MITLEDIVDVVGITIFTFVSVIIVLLVYKVEPSILKGRKGWIIIAFATMLFGIRAYGHFVDEYWFQILRRSIGIANAFLFPTGLYLVYRSHISRRGGK